MSASTPSTTARVAIVTGASQGMGEAIALRLADDGVDLVLNDVPEKKDALNAVAKRIENKGRRVLTVTGDVSLEATVQTLVDTAAEKLGGLDVMVANAGVTLYKSMLETTVEDLDKLIAVNLRGVILAFQIAAKQMIKQGRGGRLIGACSGAGKKGVKNMSAYSASKFAVRGFTQSVALELAPYNITANCYAPGAILTPMVMHPDDDKHGGPGSVAKMVAGMPADLRFAQPTVVADLVSYFAGEGAHFITGQSVNIDGGLNFD